MSPESTLSCARCSYSGLQQPVSLPGCLHPPVFYPPLTRSGIVRVKIAPPPSQRQPSVFLCAGICRHGGCNTQEGALLLKQLQIFSKLVEVKAVGLGVNRRVCLCLSCDCVCVCLSKGAMFWTPASSKGPYVLLSASGTLGLADGAQKQK